MMATRFPRSWANSERQTDCQDDRLKMQLPSYYTHTTNSPHSNCDVLAFWDDFDGKVIDQETFRDIVIRNVIQCYRAIAAMRELGGVQSAWH